MKKILMLLLVCLTFTGCRTESDRQFLNQECERLEKECRSLRSTKSYLNDEVSSLRAQIRDLNVEKNALKSGREIKYIVKFEIKQGTFTLDPFEHIKNSMNAIEVEIPVSKDYYNRLSVGQDLTDAFKFGSLVMDGDFSSLHMRVKSKRVE